MKRIIIGSAAATAVLGAVAVGAVAYADDQEPSTPSFVTVVDDTGTDTSTDTDTDTDTGQGTGIAQGAGQPQDGDRRDCPDNDGDGTTPDSPAPQSPPAPEQP